MAGVLDVIAAERQEAWFVESQSEAGVWRKVTRNPIGLWGCSCPWGEKAAERVNTKPCAHLRAVADYLALLAAQAKGQLDPAGEPEPEQPKVVDLMAALEASLEEARTHRPVPAHAAPEGEPF